MASRLQLAISGSGFAGFGASQALAGGNVDATFHEKRAVHGGQTTGPQTTGPQTTGRVQHSSESSSLLSLFCNRIFSRV